MGVSVPSLPIESTGSVIYFLLTLHEDISYVMAIYTNRPVSVGHFITFVWFYYVIHSKSSTRQ